MGETFAAWLEARLAETRMSQRELDRRFGLKGGSALSWSWVHGNSIPNPDNAEKVIRMLAVSGTEEAVRCLILTERAARDEAMAENYRERTPDHGGFAGWLPVTLGERGMSRAELARRLGMSYSTVTRWAQQKKRPSEHSRVKVAEVLGTPLADVPTR